MNSIESVGHKLADAVRANDDADREEIADELLLDEQELDFD